MTLDNVSLTFAFDPEKVKLLLCLCGLLVTFRV